MNLSVQMNAQTSYSVECLELFSKVRPSPKESSSPLPISKLGRRVQGPKRTLKEVDQVNGGKGIYVGGTLISILISLALYFSGKRETAIFVGLWAPTILNLGQSLMDED
jgi:hypothetical protein